MTFISVIVPVYNDSDALKTTVDSLLAQTYPEKAYEIIIVDNGSSDETFDVASAYAQQHPQQIGAFQESTIQSSYAARNLGISKARGELFAFIDADMIAPPHYLDELARAFEADIDYAGCAVEIVVDEPSPAALYNQSTGFPIAIYLAKDRYAPTCCLCVRRAVIDAVGPFDRRLESGGDMEFGRRVHRRGFKQAFLPQITLLHPARSHFRALYNKARRVARGHAQICHFHREEARDITRIYSYPLRYVEIKNPLSIKKRIAARSKVEISTTDALTLSCMGIPLAWAGLVSFLREAKRLRSSNEV